MTLSTLASVAAFDLLAQEPAAAQTRATQPGPVAKKAVDYAKSQIGKEYRTGATGPDAYDCSGLVQRAYRHAGTTLPRTTRDQYRKGTPVSRSNVRQGDLMFFYSRPSHVGMYVGGGRMVHAPSSGKSVAVTGLAAYWDKHFTGARRVA